MSLSIAILQAQNDTIRIIKLDEASDTISNENRHVKEYIEDDEVKPSENQLKKDDRFDLNIDEKIKEKMDKKLGKSGQFHGHWSGIEFGINSYLNKNGNFTLSEEDKFMTLNTNKSINFNLNLFDVNRSLIGDRVGLITGLGFEWYNYVFDNNNSIQKNELGNIEERTFTDPVEKSKLVATYITVPLIIECNFPGNVSASHRFHLAAGVIGSIKVRSHTRVNFDGRKNREKDWDSFNMNFLRYGFTGRVGYDKFSIYSTYYPVSLFVKDKGPELYPFNIGLSWNIF